MKLFNKKLIAEGRISNQEDTIRILRKENASLRRENKELKEKNDIITKTNYGTRITVDKLETIENKEIKKLQSEIEVLKRGE